MKKMMYISEIKMYIPNEFVFSNLIFVFNDKNIKNYKILEFASIIVHNSLNIYLKVNYFVY